MTVSQGKHGQEIGGGYTLAAMADKGARAAAAAAAVPAVLLITWGAREAGGNAAAVGVLYLILVLGLTAWGGWLAGVVASVAATACLDLFFIPPFGRLTIADPADVAALLSFLAASVVAGRLMAGARRQAEQADLRRRETEILYELCFGLFTTSHRPGILGEAAARTLRALGARAGVLTLFSSPGEPVHRIGDGMPPLDESALETVRALRSIVESDAGGGKRTVYIPLLMGGRLDGVLAAQGTAASRKVLESAGRLLALAVERERFLAESAHLAAVRASDALKTSLLRAVSHDLRTPLTGMQLALEGLGRHLAEHLADHPEAEVALRDSARELERLTRRIDNLLTLARLEAGLAIPHAEDVPAGSLFRAARESLARVLAGRPVETRVDREAPDLWADPALALEIVVNLIENAAQAAPAGTPIELSAGRDPEAPGRVRLEILDRGPGRPREGNRAGGLGLLIATGLAVANDGTLALLDRPGGGTIARVTLPAAPTLGETG